MCRKGLPLHSKPFKNTLAKIYYEHDSETENLRTGILRFSFSLYTYKICHTKLHYSYGILLSYRVYYLRCNFPTYQSYLIHSMGIPLNKKLIWHGLNNNVCCINCLTICTITGSKVYIPPGETSDVVLPLFIDGRSRFSVSTYNDFIV